MGVIMKNKVNYTGGSSGGGGNANEMTLTMAEYLALTEEQRMDGTTYYITDAVSTKEIQPVIYSEEEREIGVWIDGKPLYQKTISCGALPDNTIKYIPHGISNIDFIVNYFGIAKDSNGNFGTFPWVSLYNIANGFVTSVDLSDIIYLSRSNLSDYSESYFTIQYTKTTDVAGGATWTTNGVPAVHYDGTEKVIGTWFGETLYERSYDLTLPSAFDVSGGFLIDNDVSYIKMLVSAEGSGKSPEGYITNMGGLAGAQVWQYNVHRNPSNQLVLYSGQSSSAIAGGKVAITIRYTKTS